MNKCQGVLIIKLMGFYKKCKGTNKNDCNNEVTIIINKVIERRGCTVCS